MVILIGVGGKPFRASQAGFDMPVLDNSKSARRGLVRDKVLW